MAMGSTNLNDTDALAALVKQLHAVAYHGDGNYEWHNQYCDDGETIHYASHYSPDDSHDHNNRLYSSIVELSSAIPVPLQSQLIKTLKAQSPSELRHLQLGCMTAEYAMELYYSAVAVNEVRAHARAGSLVPPLPEDASSRDRIQRLFEILGPSEYLGTPPRRPFQYSENYQHLADAELEIMEKVGNQKFGPDSQLVVAGSGPLPLTALLLHIRTGASVACLDADYISCRQQFELVKELERAGVVKPGAITVINDHPGRIQYDHYMGIENGLKKKPDGLFVTYFARDMGETFNHHSAVDNETPISNGIASPRFFSPVKDVLTRAREAGIPLANVREASGTTELLYPSVTEEDLEGVSPVSMFVPDNKATAHTHHDASGKAPELLVRPGVHNSSIAVTLPPIERSTSLSARHKTKRSGWFQGILTDEHLPRTKEAISAFEKAHFSPAYRDVVRDRQGLDWQLV